MKKLLYLLCALFASIELNACSPDDNIINDSPAETPETPDDSGSDSVTGKTLIVYYSFTNNVHTIVSDLRTQIEADAIRIEPAEKGLDYAANNYAIGSAQIRCKRSCSIMAQKWLANESD